MIEAGGNIWIPCFTFVKQCVEIHRSKLEQHYIIRFEKNPDMNELHKAAGLLDVEKRLMACPDTLVNGNQTRNLVQDSPFVCLTYKGTTIEDAGIKGSL